GDAKKKHVLDVTFEVVGESVPLVAGETSPLYLKVKDKDGRYKIEEKVILIFRESGGESEDPSNPPNGEPKDPELPEMDNPIDEKGEHKFNVKIIQKKEEMDPFDYYKENANGFSSTVFDGWVLNIKEITSTTNVPTYVFKEGVWEGSPLSCQGEDIGVGQLNHTKNLRYYKYSTQEERWRERGYAPSIDENEKEKRKRFLFFRFTGRASGIELDSSMFCVDTHTKFLFYYSDPASISTFGVPSNWKDYDEPDYGEHKQFDKPFYMTDPIGFVKENGECVIYTWCKQHIQNKNYLAPFNSTFIKEATTKTSGYGYSPYRYKKVKTTKERIVKENPRYTASKPVVLDQTYSFYSTLDSADEAKLTLKMRKAPEGEELSFQWFKHTENSQKGGQLIAGAVADSYVVEKQLIDAYFYCVVTNKNTKNGKEASTISTPIKVRITQTQNELKIDAETPTFKKHPKDAVYSLVEGENVKLSLKVEANKLNDSGVLSYQWFESATENAGTKIVGATSNIFEKEVSEVGTKYYYCEVTNTNTNATGEKTVSATSDMAKIVIEEIYNLTFGCVGEGSVKVFGALDGGQHIVENGGEATIKVKSESTLVFVAKPSHGYEIEKWEGGVEVEANKQIAQIKIKNKDDVKQSIYVNFSKIQKKGKLAITSIRVDNVSINGRFWGAYKYGAWFYWDIMALVKDDSNAEASHLLWDQNSYNFLYMQGSGNSALFMPEANAKVIDMIMNNTEGKFKLDFKITKRDSATSAIGTDHTWLMVDHGKGAVEFEYDGEKDCWNVKDASYNIDKVEVSYKKDFVLKRGNERDFAVTYTANNPDLYADGAVKVVYTLSWN
ncbi:MAG: hypothetical protein ACTTKH_06800, partial [Treponema sp.]